MSMLTMRGITLVSWKLKLVFLLSKFRLLIALCVLIVDDERTRNDLTSHCIAPDLLGPQIEMSEINQQPLELSVNVVG